MARGILFADVVNTVSERYAQEILTPEYGERLDPILRDRKDRLFGIVNGIDYEVLNPAIDSHIAQHFDADHLDQRVANKPALQAEAGLVQDARTPVLGSISRLADQKGFDILGDAIDHILDLGVQFVLLGTGDQHYHEMFTRIAQQYPGRMAVSLTFNAPLAQKIYAGSDIFLMPSRFEPCGLGQMIAMRYGSVPVVRLTGGLADTVRDFNPATGEGTGFVFEKYDRWALFAAVVRALENYRNPSVWRQIQQQGMRTDFSWEASARKYIDLYYRALEFKAQRCLFTG
jgi:starch synthase